MSKEWTLAGALAHFGAKSRNRRSIWSGRSDDDQTVVLCLWQDLIHRRGGKFVYDDFERADDEPEEEWMHLPGARERLDNLKWAQDHCGGHFRVVVVIGKDGKHQVIAKCFPQDKLRMRIEALDEATGRFRAAQASE